MNMKLKTFLLVISLMMHLVSWGYSTSDTFYDNGIKYQVTGTNYSNLTCKAIGYDKTICTDPLLVIPGTCHEAKENYDFKVTAVSITRADPTTSIEIQENITSVTLSGTWNLVKLPKSATSFAVNSSGQRFKEFECAPGGMFSYDPVGHNLIENETALRYHDALGTVNGEYTIPDGIKTISAHAFLFDGTLKTLTIGKDVTSVANSATYNKALIAYKVADGNTSFSVQDGVLFNSTGTKLVCYPRGKSGTTYTVPDGCTSIGGIAFYWFTTLKTINLNNVTSLANQAFHSMDGLTTINLGNMTSIASGAFNSCNNISKYEVSETNTVYSSQDGVIFNKEKTALVLCPAKFTGINKDKQYTIPDGVKTIESRAFSSSDLTTIILDDALSTIKSAAFQGCAVSKLDMRNTSITTIASNSLLETYSLRELILPIKATKVEGALNKSGVKKITVPDGSKLTTLNASCFASLTSLTDFIFEGSCPNLTTVGNSAFSGCTALTSIQLPSSVKSIGSNAFYNCKTLTEFTLPSACTSIGSQAFLKCANMRTFVIPDDTQLKTIGANVFEGSGIETISIPEGITSIGNEAFKSCDVMTAITLPASLTTIDTEAFKFCYSLEHINVAEGNTSLSSIDGILLNKDKTMLKLFPPGKASDSFTLLPPSIETLDTKSFYFCQNLENLTLPNKVTTIKDRALYECSAMNTLTLLCDQKITVDMSSGAETFSDNMLGKKITLNVRKELYEDYINDSFFSTNFNIVPSTVIDDKEYIAVSDNAVDLLDVRGADNTYVIEPKVRINSKDYNIALIGDYAFQNNENQVKEVVIKGNVGYVGANAFMTDVENKTSVIDNVFFLGNAPAGEALSTDRFELADAYNSFTSGQKVYVRRSQLEGYKSAFASQQSQVTYEIPTSDIMPNAECGSFAREFAVDLSNDGANTASTPQLIAFVPMRLNQLTDDTYSVRMQSINEGEEGDGTYIPAGTGVVLRKYGSAQPTYYEIAESQTSSSNGMSPAVICNSGQIPASTSTQWNYYIGKNDGLAHKATKKTNIGVHKSYLSISVESGAKAVTFSFRNLEDITTDISLTKGESTEEGEWYSVTGQKTKRPSAGLFIRNGKKFIVK